MCPVVLVVEVLVVVVVERPPFRVLDEALNRVAREELAVGLRDAPVELAVERLRRRRVEEVDLAVDVSNASLRPAEMYHRPSKTRVSNFFTIASGDGSGYAPSSWRCGTHFFCDTAHALKSPTTSFSKRSPQRIWHSDSSLRPVQLLMHTRFAAHLGDVRHRASLPVHCETTHRPAGGGSLIAADAENGAAAATTRLAKAAAHWRGSFGGVMRLVLFEGCC